MSKESASEKFQTIGTLVALIISFSALFVSIYEANILKSQQKAAVWPYLNITPNYNNEGFTLKVENKGIGPAIVKSMQVNYNGKPIGNHQQLYDSLKPNRTVGYDVLTNNSVNGYVLSSGETVHLIGFPWNDETREMIKNLKNLDTQIYYESVQGEGWTYDSRDDSNKKKKFKAKVEYEK